MTNDFSQKDRDLFDDCYTCWWCGISHANSAHHILQRGSKNDDAESSPLNLAPVNNEECHIGNKHTELLQENNKLKFLRKTWEYLKYKKQYELKEKDLRFIIKYKKYYLEICKEEVQKILSEQMKLNEFNL